jgi:tetratricopeptide (TPR) repeat protein
MAWSKLHAVRTREIGIHGSVAVAIVCLTLAGPTGAAHAEPSADDSARLRAQELLERGNELFRAGDMTGALRAYSEAHQAFASPKLFFNMGQCEEGLTHRPAAMRHFNDFLRLTTDAEPRVRAEAETRVAALAKQLLALDLALIAANAAVRIDDQVAGLTPIKQPVWLEPGAHRIAVDRPGRPLWVSSIEGRAGERVSVIVPDTPPPPELPKLPKPMDQPETVAHRPVWRRWWFWSGLGLIVAGGAAVAFIKLRNSCGQTVCE